MGIFESHPLDAIEIDTVIVLQNAADPSGGGHGVSPYADPAAREVGQRDPSAPGIVDEKRVRQSAHHHRGQQHQRFAVSLRLQESDDRQFGDVVLQMAHDVLERSVRHSYIGKIEDKIPRTDFAGLQRQCVGIIAQKRSKIQNIGIIAHVLLS